MQFYPRAFAPLYQGIILTDNTLDLNFCNTIIKIMCLYINYKGKRIKKDVIIYPEGRLMPLLKAIKEIRGL
jgi:hypothetical protein